MSSYLAAVAVLALLAAVPGPDVAVVTRFAFADGRVPAVRAAVGVVLGLTIWGMLAVLGIAAVLAASADAYAIVKLLGAVYLVVMGVRVLRASRLHDGVDSAMPSRPPGAPLRAGFVTNLLNPKIAVFYTSVLPSLVPRGGSTGVWLAALVATHAALSLGWLTGYAVAFSHSRSFLARPSARRLLERMTGVVLIGFGVRVAAEAR